jgi:hypothetical protein
VDSRDRQHSGDHHRNRVQCQLCGDDQQSKLAIDDLLLYPHLVTDYDSVQRHYPRQSFQYARIARRNDFGEHNDQRAYQSIHLWHHDWHRAHCLHVQHQSSNKHFFLVVWLFIDDYPCHHLQSAKHWGSLRWQCSESATSYRLHH